MKKEQINESLNYLDMENLVLPLVGVDVYKSSVGKDADVITLSFIVKDECAASDLVEWFERGYNFVLDADRSPSEVAKGKYLVFVEIERNKVAPKHILDLISDLETLTGLTMDQWKLKINHEKGDASEEFITSQLALSPKEYKQEYDDELNEWRSIAGVSTSKNTVDDPDIIAMQRQAGII